MSFRKLIELECDGDEGYCLGHISCTENRVSEARKHAAQFFMWSYINGKDLCKKCMKKEDQ